MAPTPFRDLLKTKREAAGYTQKSLGDKAELSNGSIGFYETGRQKPRIDSLLRIFDALALTKEERAQWLLATGLSIPNTDDGELQRTPDTRLLQSMERIRGLEPDDQEKALDTLDLIVAGLEREGAKSVGTIGTTASDAKPTHRTMDASDFEE